MSNRLVNKINDDINNCNDNCTTKHTNSIGNNGDNCTDDEIISNLLSIPSNRNKKWDKDNSIDDDNNIYARMLSNLLSELLKCNDDDIDCVSILVTELSIRTDVLVLLSTLLDCNDKDIHI